MSALRVAKPSSFSMSLLFDGIRTDMPADEGAVLFQLFRERCEVLVISVTAFMAGKPHNKTVMRI